MEKKGYISNTFTLVNNAVLKNDSFRKIKNLYYYIDWFLLKFIKKPKRINDDKKRVVICFNLFLGDGAIFIPSLKNLREIYPKNKYEITLFTQKGLNKLYEKLEIFDEVVPLSFTSSTVNLKDRVAVFKAIRSKYYDIALDPIGIEECTQNVLNNRAICADEKIGIINYDKKIYCPKRIYNKIYSNLIETYGNKKSYIEQYNDFFNGLTDKKTKVEFVNLPSEKVKEALPSDYFIIYPSASTEYKRWPVDRYAEIAKKMYKKLNIPLVLCGTKADTDINNEFIELIKDQVKYIDMLGKTSVLEYVDLIKKAKFVVTNDTGIFHIATISQVPVAGIVGGYTYDKFISYDFDGCENFKRPYLIVEHMDCFNCDNRCKYKNEIKHTWPCLDKITIEKAWSKIERMIQENI